MEVRGLRRPSLLDAYERLQIIPRVEFAEEDFYKALLGFITALVKRSCHDQHTFGNIEDSIQESALEIWQRLPEFNKARSPLPAWVALITLHNVRDALRRSKNHPPGPGRLADQQPDEENLASKSLPVDVQFDLKEFRERLAPLDRTILHMATDGLTLREIGQALGLSHETVRKRLKKLKPQVDKSHS